MTQSQIMELWTANIPTRILEYVLMTQNVLKLIIVSPWISPQRDCRLLEILCRRIDKEQIACMVITRTPRDTWHSEAIGLLRSAGSRIYYNDWLHAKIYVVKAENLDYGFFGSANLTYSANFTDDLAILIRGVGEGKGIVERLTLYAYHLKG